MKAPKAPALRSTYHPPRFIPEIQEDGLTSDDLAEALGVRSRDIIRKVLKIDAAAYSAIGWNFATGVAKTGKRGRPRDLAFFNTAAAKVIVARWENDKGNGYLNFLFDCEWDAIYENPRLRAELAEAKQELARAYKIDNVRRLPSKSTVDVPVSYVIQGSLFGDSIIVPVLKKIDKDRLTPQEQRRAKSVHLTRVVEGATKAKRKIEDEEMIESLPPLCRPL